MLYIDFKKIKSSITYVESILLALLFCCIFGVENGYAQDSSLGKIKKVCIDAGHGGHDSGALGSKTKEKDIALAVALKLGQLISEKYPDVEVVYTRKTDVFVKLTDRTKFANDQKADLFISIHLNSDASHNGHGIETLVLGTNNSSLNMQAAIRENSALKYEDDYSVTRETFDPTSPESYIIFNLIRNVHLNESLDLAGYIQSNLIKATGRTDRKVKQQPLWVLKDASMPAVLVEIGFISNPTEENALRTAADQTKVANAILKAFGEYKEKIERNSNVLSADAETPASGANGITATTAGTTAGSAGSATANSDEWFYAVQIGSMTEPVDDTKRFGAPAEVGEVGCLEGDGRYRYYVGATQRYSDVEKTLKTVKAKIKGAYIISVRGGELVDVNELKSLENRKNR